MILIMMMIRKLAVIFLLLRSAYLLLYMKLVTLIALYWQTQK